jgi:SAM-dependent methyltransferase
VPYDPTIYAGSAAHYRLGRPPYSRHLEARLSEELRLDGHGRLLDVGCGPGTNSKYFAHSDYLGLDINEDYIKDARQRYRRPFIACDVRTYRPTQKASFDFVLVNSFLHHLDAADVCNILTHLTSVLTEDGHVHILELVMPPNASVSRLLAQWDRGKFARTRQEWELLFSRVFEPVMFESYPLTGAGVTLWNMLYFKGKLRK